MPRKPMKASQEMNLSDHLTLGAVMRVYPRKVIETHLDRTGRNSIRVRRLPAFLVVYLVIMLAMYSEVSVRENLRIVLEGLRRKFGNDETPVAGGTAISHQRQRIGKEPFREMFEEIVRPVADKGLKGCFFKRWRIVAVDGNHIEVQNTEENREAFGVHRNQHGESGYPIMKWVCLTECGTRVVFAANVGGVRDSEAELFEPLIERLDAGMIHLADRYYYSFDRWKRCGARGAALVWRVRSNLILKPETVLPDGSYLAWVRPSNKLVRRGVCDKKEKMLARVIEYQVEFEDGTQSEIVRLITSLLDPDDASAEELACLYTERWNVETGFDELKTHLKGSGRVLRSQLPELVEQEFYGFLLAYFVVRKVMADAARKGDVSPAEISFVHAVRVIKRRLTENIPPCGEEKSFEVVV